MAGGGAVGDGGRTIGALRDGGMWRVGMVCVYGGGDSERCVRVGGCGFLCGGLGVGRGLHDGLKWRALPPRGGGNGSCCPGAAALPPPGAAARRRRLDGCNVYECYVCE